MLSRICISVDINTNAITFTSEESFVKRNFLATDKSEEKYMMKGIFDEQILINLRTYDTTSLVLYANDHLNNFVQIYLANSTQVVYLFNHGDEIHNITVEYTKLNSSEPVQIAIQRTNASTTLYVNESFKSVPVGVQLLMEYSNKPWSNPDKGIT